MIRAWRATDAQVKRDALAFIVMAIAVLVALREWFGISGQAGDFIHLCAAGFVGIFSVVLPIILVAFSVELVRVRSGNSALPLLCRVSSRPLRKFSLAPPRRR